MPLSICTDCFARLRISPKLQSIASSSFATTSASRAYDPKKWAKGAGPTYRSSLTNKKSKKRAVRKVPKLPMVGERKALRKRIVLSNTNALEVQGLQDLTVKNMVDELQIGRVLALNGELLDQLREVKAFKRTQNWKMFRKPGTLMRRESVELGRTFLDVKASNSEQKPRTVRRIIAGAQNTGKSLMLVQAMSMAFLNDWVVINVPEGIFRMIDNS
jgi:small subunit ribosomal protein S29